MLQRLILALALAAAPGWCLAQQLRVVTTSADLKSLVEAVAGARVDVESLTLPAQDPHTVELKPAQLAHVRSAALLVRVGLDQSLGSRGFDSPKATSPRRLADVRLIHPPAAAHGRTGRTCAARQHALLA